MRFKTPLQSLVAAITPKAVAAVLGCAALTSSAEPLHPRMFFDADAVPALRAKVQDEPYASMLQQIIRNINSRDYNQRGGNFAAAYLLTGDESYARMAALRALAYISDTERWENNAAWGLRRGIDNVAVMHLLDFCYNSQTWADMLVPAEVTPELFTIDGVAVWIPGSWTTLSADGIWATGYTPVTWSVPSKYVGLPLREAISLAIKNNSDSLMASGGGAWPGNDDVANNWHAVRFAGAGLGYLVSNHDSGDSLNQAISRFMVHVDANLSTSALGKGWNPEGVAYAQFPGWYSYPFAIALKRLTGRDLVAENPNMRYALWSTYMGLLPWPRVSRLGLGLGVRPDFDDDHNIWEGEGTGALAFAFAYNDDPNDAIPDFDYRPGLKYLFRRVAGDLGDQLWDTASGNGIYSILYYPADAEITEQNPDQVWGRTYYDPSYGAVMFRSGHQDGDFSLDANGQQAMVSEDIVFQTTANNRDVAGGHGGPDELTFRLFGKGVPWAVGSGRVWDIRGQSGFIYDDPETLPAQVGINYFGTRIEDIFMRKSTGEGYVVMAADLTTTGTTNHHRRMVVDYSERTGADGFFIVSDSSDDETPFWRLNTYYANSIDTAVPNQFTITSPEGHRLIGKIIWPQSTTLRTGEYRRGNEFVLGDSFEWNNKWVDFGTSGDAVVAMLLVDANDPTPTVIASGDPTSGFTVTAGSLTIQLHGDNITSPDWNPPSVALTSISEGQAFTTGTTAETRSITLSGTASDVLGGTVERIDIYLNDQLQQSLDVSATSLNWGPVVLDNVPWGDHKVQVIVTDNEGDERAVVRNFRVTRTVPPSIEITSPVASHRIYEGQTLTLSGIFADPDSAIDRIEIWDNISTQNPTLQLRGLASRDATFGTWAYTWHHFKIGTHRVYAVIYDEHGDVTQSESIELVGSFLFGDGGTYADAGLFSQIEGIDSAFRWSVKQDNGNFVVRVDDAGDHRNMFSFLKGSDSPIFDHFEFEFDVKTLSDTALNPNFFFNFGPEVMVNFDTFNSVIPQYSWVNATVGTRVIRFGANATRPAVLYGLNPYEYTDPGYPDQPFTDKAGIPNADWNHVKVRRVGTQLNVWVNDTEIINGSDLYIGMKSLMGLGNDRDDAEYTFLFDNLALRPLYDDGTDAAYQLDQTLISFDAPANHADLPAGQSVTLSGTISDPDGFKSITLFRGATPVAELTPDAHGNWSWSWDAPRHGTYQFYVHSVDVGDFESRSAPRFITVSASGGPGGNLPPTVTLAENTGITDALALTGSASDPDGSVVAVHLYKDGSFFRQAALNGASFSSQITNLEPGLHSFVARAIDDTGAFTDSAPFVVNLTAPTIDASGLAALNSVTVGLSTVLAATVSSDSPLARVEFFIDDAKLADGVLLNGAWQATWSPRFYGTFTVSIRATNTQGVVSEVSVSDIAVVPDVSSNGALLTYAGSADAQARFNDMVALSDGTLLVAGAANHLNWLSGVAPQSLAVPSSLPDIASGKTGFLLHLSADASTILNAVALPHGHAASIRWIKMTNKVGAPTGTLFVSGSLDASRYFIARLNGNFVDQLPSALTWALTPQATGVNADLQSWDVGGDGRVVYYDESDLGHGTMTSVRFADANGNPLVLPALRATHYAAASDLTLGDGIPRKVADLTGTPDRSLIRFPRDLQSAVSLNSDGIIASGLDQNLDGTPDWMELSDDGNGSLKMGRWPLDIFLPVLRMEVLASPTATATTVYTYGYNGYRSGGGNRIGGIAVDRDTNAFFIGFNNQSKFYDPAAKINQPDFEPGVVAYAADGSLAWWSRGYAEWKDHNGDGNIQWGTQDGTIDDRLTRLYHGNQPENHPFEGGETYQSSPDQYIDGLAIDYADSAPLLVVNARAHGNNASNFWSGNEIAAKPGANGFQNRFTGTEGNIHISYISKLSAASGQLQAATWVSGFFRFGVSLDQGAYAEPIHDNWPSHNLGWPDLTTTKVEDSSLRVGPDGRVYMVGVGPRMVTTFNAHQKIPYKTSAVNQGAAPWHSFVRVFEPDLSALAYSSAVTGVWDYPNGDKEQSPLGANNTQLLGVFPGNNAAHIVGFHQADSGNVALGNAIPTNKIPTWGAAVPSGQSAIFGSLSFLTSANIPPSIQLTQPATHWDMPPGESVAITFTASDPDSGVDRIEIYANGERVTTLTEEPFSYDWTPTGAEGSQYNVFGLVFDVDGDSTLSNSFTLRLLNVPTVTLTQPSANATVAKDYVTSIVANASDVAPGFVAQVDFFVNGTRIGSDASAPFSIDWTPPALGSYTLHAVAIDNSGGTGRSLDVPVTAIEGNIAPDITLLAPLDGRSYNVAYPLLLRAEATDQSGIAAVEFFANGNPIGTAVAAGSGIYELEWLPSMGGAVSLHAVATDDGLPNGMLSTATAPIAISLVSSSPPLAPDALTGNALSWQRVALQWNDRATDEQVFLLERRILGGAWEQIVQLPANSTAFTDSGLLAESTYEYRVSAVNAIGASEPSAPFALTTTALSQKVFLYASPNTDAGLYPTTAFSEMSFAVDGVLTPFSDDLDAHILDFANSKNQILTLDQDLYVYAIRGVTANFTVQGTGTLHVGSGGISGNGNYKSISMGSVRLHGSQTWDVGSGTLREFDMLSAFDHTVLTLRSTLSVKPANLVGFDGTLVVFPVTHLSKIESDFFSTRAVVRLPDFDGFDSGNTARLSMRGNFTLGGLEGEGEAFAGLGRNVTLTLDVKNNRTARFTGKLFESDPDPALANGLHIVKRGLGKQIFDSVHNTYAMTTVVEAGELQFDGSKVGPGTIEVQSGATLSGTASLSGDTTVLSGGSLSPAAANATGTLSFVHDLSLDSAAALRCEIDANADRVVVGGDLSLPTAGADPVLLKVVALLPLAELPDVSSGLPLFEVSGTIHNFAPDRFALDLSDTPWDSATVVLSGNAIVLTDLNTSSYANWASAHGADPASVLTNSNDNDLLADGAEYFFGTSTASNQSSLGGLFEAHHFAQQVKIRFQKRKQTPDVTMTLLARSASQDWTPLSAAAVKFSETADVELFEVSFPHDSADPSLELRMQIAIDGFPSELLSLAPLDHFLTATIEAIAASADESDQRSAQFRIALSSISIGDLRVNYAISGTADTADYQESLPGFVTIANGTTSALISVTPVDDALVEQTESLTLTLTAGNAYIPGNPTAATIYLYSDDVLSGYELWSSTQPWNAAPSDPLSDADRDGMPNLMEYALNGNPIDPHSTPFPLFIQHDGHLSLRFFRHSSELTYTIEGSTDLLNWSTLYTNPGTVGATVEAIDPATPNPSTPRFLRLKISH